MDKDNGGPAFPHVDPNYDGNWNKEPQRGGMTLRDWFAGQALVEWSSTLTLGVGTDDIQKTRIAKICYQFADAMIAERNK